MCLVASIWALWTQHISITAESGFGWCCLQPKPGGDVPGGTPVPWWALLENQKLRASSSVLSSLVPFLLQVYGILTMLQVT